MSPLLASGELDALAHAAELAELRCRYAEMVDTLCGYVDARSAQVARCIAHQLGERLRRLEQRALRQARGLA